MRKEAVSRLVVAKALAYLQSSLFLLFVFFVNLYYVRAIRVIRLLVSARVCLFLVFRSVSVRCFFAT